MKKKNAGQMIPIFSAAYVIQIAYNVALRLVYSFPLTVTIFCRFHFFNSFGNVVAQATFFVFAIILNNNKDGLSLKVT